MIWSWKEGVRFALAAKIIKDDGSLFDYPKNRVETFGSTVLFPLYKSINYISQQIRKRHMIAFLTLLAGLIALFVFYNIPAIKFLGFLFHPQRMRFLLFCFFQINILAAGCNAFGRFSNPSLVEAWKSQKLKAVFPGDKSNF